MTGDEAVGIASFYAVSRSAERGFCQPSGRMWLVSGGLVAVSPALGVSGGGALAAGLSGVSAGGGYGGERWCATSIRSRYVSISEQLMTDIVQAMPFR